MELFLNKSKVNQDELKRLITNVTATELSNLSEPCYCPTLKKYYYEQLRYCGVTDEEVGQYMEKFYEDSPRKNDLMIVDRITNLNIFIMQYFLKQKDKIGFANTMVYHHIRFYTNLFNRQFPKWCNPVAFKYALEHISKNHLYSVHKTIGSSLYYLSYEMIDRYGLAIGKNDREGIIKFIKESRGRISQSIKSFAEEYYKAQDEGLGYQSPQEDAEGTEQVESVKSSKVVTDTVKKITVFRILDPKALQDAKQYTKVSNDFSKAVVTELANTKYSDRVRIILDLYINSITNVKNICSPVFYETVQKLMATKRSNSYIYFKQQVEELLELILEETKLKKKFESQTSQTQFLSKSFLAYYITMVLRNSIC